MVSGIGLIHTTGAWEDDAIMGYIEEMLGDVWKVENGREVNVCNDMVIDIYVGNGTKLCDSMLRVGASVRELGLKNSTRKIPTVVAQPPSSLLTIITKLL